MDLAPTSEQQLLRQRQLQNLDQQRQHHRMKNRDFQGVDQRAAPVGGLLLRQHDAEGAQGDGEDDESQDRTPQGGLAEGKIDQRQAEVAAVHQRRRHRQRPAFLEVEAGQPAETEGEAEQQQGIDEHEQYQVDRQAQIDGAFGQSGKRQRRGEEVEGAVAEGLDVRRELFFQPESGANQ